MQYQKLPRRDLRLQAFVKFQPFIEAAARQTSLLLQPSDLIGKSNDTFCSRFNDAKLGYRMFHYPCNLPTGFDVTMLKASPVEGGGVLIENLAASKFIQQRTTVVIKGDMGLIETELAALSNKPNNRISFYTTTQTPAEAILAVAERFPNIYNAESDVPGALTFVSFVPSDQISPELFAESPIPLAALDDLPEDAPPKTFMDKLDGVHVEAKPPTIEEINAPTTPTVIAKPLSEYTPEERAKLPKFT